MHSSVKQALGRPPIPRLLLPGLALLVLAAPVTGADLDVVETVQMDFGAVLDHDGAVTLGLNDNLVSDPAGIQAGGVLQSGRFLITGDPFAAFSLDVNGSSEDGLSLASFNTSAGQPPVLNAVLNGAGQLSVRFGAVLTVEDSRAAPGLDQLLAYTITIDYN
jgi:hypothetical protein